MAGHIARAEGAFVRYVILIIVIVCGACIAAGDLVGRFERAGAGPQPPTLMQAPVTQAELDARCQTRLAEIQREQPQAAALVTPPPAQPPPPHEEFACDADVDEV